jgi:hypothetical protein
MLKFYKSFCDKQRQTTSTFASGVASAYTTHTFTSNAEHVFFQRKYMWLLLSSLAHRLHREFCALPRILVFEISLWTQLRSLLQELQCTDQNDTERSPLWWQSSQLVSFFEFHATVRHSVHWRHPWVTASTSPTTQLTLLSAWHWPDVRVSVCSTCPYAAVHRAVDVSTTIPVPPTAVCSRRIQQQSPSIQMDISLHIRYKCLYSLLRAGCIND